MKRIITLGPTGSCHENAAYAYIQSINDDEAKIILVDDVLKGAEQALDGTDGYLIQCSAHLNVHLVTERYRGKLHVYDTFIYPTQSMALIKRRDVKNPKSIGIPEPALGYIDPEAWDIITYENTKPVVTKNLLLGKYDAGFAYVRDAEKYPEELEICETVGEVVTTWIVYSTKVRYSGSLIKTIT